MPKITWPQFNKEITVNAGTTVLDAALEHDIPLNHACGGFCACTTCHFYVIEGSENLSAIDDMEKERLESADGYSTRSRLGCQAQVQGDVTIEIPKES